MTASHQALSSARDSGLGILVEKLSRLKAVPTLQEICQWLSEAQFSESEIAPLSTFSDEKYTRTRVFGNGFVEVLIIGWLPRQESWIHDHDGSVGAVCVVEGTVEETKFRWDKGLLSVASKNSASEGAVVSVIEPDIHQLRNSEDCCAVSVHVYAPPLAGLTIYDPATGNATYLALDSEEQ